MSNLSLVIFGAIIFICLYKFCQLVKNEYMHYVIIILFLIVTGGATKGTDVVNFVSTTSAKEQVKTYTLSNVSKQYSPSSNLEFVNIMKKEAPDTNIFKSVIIAQAIHESDYGKSGLSKNHKNLFGVKADKSWSGEVIVLPTQECINGQYITVNSGFRKYKSWKDSMIDHSNFLNQHSRYRNNGVFAAKNYKEQVSAIKKAGYATDPNYVSKVISIIEQYKLYELDKG